MVEETIRTLDKGHNAYKHVLPSKRPPVPSPSDLALSSKHKLGKIARLVLRDVGRPSSKYSREFKKALSAYESDLKYRRRRRKEQLSQGLRLYRDISQGSSSKKQQQSKKKRRDSDSEDERRRNRRKRSADGLNKMGGFK